MKKEDVDKIVSTVFDTTDVDFESFKLHSPYTGFQLGRLIGYMQQCTQSLLYEHCDKEKLKSEDVDYVVQMVFEIKADIEFLDTTMFYGNHFRVGRYLGRMQEVLRSSLYEYCE